VNETTLLLDTIAQAIRDLRGDSPDLYEIANDLAFAHAAVHARRSRDGSPTPDGPPPVRGEGAAHLRLVEEP
jgi:hypothetical protein